MHNVAFGVALKRKMDALGVEADLAYPGSKNTYRNNVDFFKAKFFEQSRHSAVENEAVRKPSKLGERPRDRVVRIFKETSPAIGEPLPDLDCFDEQGQTVKLRGLKGHYTVLVFGCLT